MASVRPQFADRTSAARANGPSVRCAASQGKESDPVLRYAESIGLPVSEGVFGFKPFSEVGKDQ